MDLPEYFNQIKDEKLRKEIWEKLQNDIVAKADFTKHAQGKADELKALQEQLDAKAAENTKFSDWYYKTYEPWLKNVQPALDSYNNPNPQPQIQPSNGIPQAGNDPYANYENMLPAEQAKLLQEQITATLNNQFTTWSRGLATNLDTVLKDREKYYQDYLGLYVDANEKKRGNPDLDITSYMNRALQLRSGKENPMEVAYTLETLEADKKKWIEDGRALGRKDLETELEEKKKSELPSFNSGPEPYKAPEPVSAGDRQTGLKDKVTEKFGAGIWSR
ncbi:MAG: hypothetical protein V3W37_06145 [Candidatus Binatia bacterium]